IVRICASLVSTAFRAHSSARCRYSPAVSCWGTNPFLSMLHGGRSTRLLLCWSDTAVPRRLSDGCLVRTVPFRHNAPHRTLLLYVIAPACHWRKRGGLRGPHGAMP